MKTNKEILMKFVSTQGYKRNSPDKNRPVNVIPSNQITMQDVDFPVRGVDNLGNEQVMQPGEDYTFPGSYVVETPVAQQGGERTFLNTASQFIPGYETYLDIKDMYLGANQGDKEQLNRGILGVMSPLSGKAVLSAADYLSDKIIGVDATNKNASKRNEILNMSTSDLQKLYITYGPGGYDKWVADGKPDLNKKHQGGEMIKRADGSYSQRGLWDNIRNNKGSGKKPTKEMLEQERKIKASQKGGSVKTVYHDDKELFDKAYKAETDSLSLYERFKAQDSKIKNSGLYRSNPEHPDEVSSAKETEIEPVYVFDKNDPRYKSYNDSLRLYNAYVMQDKLMGPGNKKVKSDLKWGSKELKDGRVKKVIKGLEELGPLAQDYESEHEQFKNGFNESARKEDKKLINYYKQLGFNDNDIMYHSSPDIVNDKIKSIGTYNDGTALSPIYKKPVQEVIVQEPGRTPSKTPSKKEPQLQKQTVQKAFQEPGYTTEIITTNDNHIKRYRDSAGKIVKEEVYDMNGKLVSPKEFQKGGTFEPIYVSDKNDPRLKAYTDSLGLYNQGIEPFVHFDDFTGKNPLKEYAKKNYVPRGEGKPVSREQILNEINTIKEELVWQDRPALIKNANDRLALLNKSLETGVYPANLAYPDQPINALVYKKPVVPVEYKKPNTIVKEESYKMDNKQVSSEETEKTGGYIYATGGMYDGYMSNPMEVIYAEGGESEQPQMQQGPDIEAAIGQISGMIAQGEDPEDIYDMLIESGVPEEYAQGYMSEAMSDLEEDDMEEEDVPMDDDEMKEYEQDDESEEDMPDDEESEGETEMKRGGTIKIKPSRKGTFKAQATKMGMSVAEAADYILRHKDEFTPAMVKKANFAKNFAKELGGEIYDLAKFEGGGIPDRYRKLGFTRVGAKRRSTRPGKKWMVLAKKGDKYKIIHGGYKGMKDFTQHHNPKRRERFWNRMGGKDSAKARDPFSPLYWHKRFGTWEMGGGVYTKDRMYKAQSGGPAKTYDQWLSENMNRPDIMQNSQSPDYLANMYNMEVSRTPSQTPVQPRMTRTGGSGMGAMELLDPMVPNADNPYDLTLPATHPAVAPQTSKLVAPPGWNAVNNTEGLSPTGTMVQDEPKDRSGFNWRRNAGDIMLGSMGVVNQLKMRKDYEKEYKQRLQRTGNTDQRYNAYTPENPFGNYTLNAGPGSNFALVTNTPTQDFGTRMAGAKYGGTTSYKQGGEYYASDDEIKMILAMGGEIEFLD